MTLVSQPAAQAQNADCFRALMRRQASSVTVVDCPGLPPAWLTTTGFTSVSLRPPLTGLRGRSPATYGADGIRR